MEFEDLKQKFGTDRQCQEYIGRLRWINGFLCPECSGREAWITAKAEYKCKECGQRVSVTVGTIFEGSHIPLPTWFEIIWYLCESEFHCSGAELQRRFNLGSNRTAQRIKKQLDSVAKLMYSAYPLKKLKGIVEVNSGTVIVNGKSEPVIIAVKVSPSNNQIIRMEKMESEFLSLEQITNFIQKNVKAGSTIICDRLSVSAWLFKKDGPGYKKKPSRTNYQYARIKRAARAVGKWLKGDSESPNFDLENSIQRCCSYLENCGNPIPFDSFLKIAVQTKTPARLEKDEKKKAEKEKARRQESAGE